MYLDLSRFLSRDNTMNGWQLYGTAAASESHPPRHLTPTKQPPPSNACRVYLEAIFQHYFLMSHVMWFMSFAVQSRTWRVELVVSRAIPTLTFMAHNIVSQSDRDFNYKASVNAAQSSHVLVCSMRSSFLLTEQTPFPHPPRTMETNQQQPNHHRQPSFHSPRPEINFHPSDWFANIDIIFCTRPVHCDDWFSIPVISQRGSALLWRNPGECHDCFDGL